MPVKIFLNFSLFLLFAVNIAFGQKPELLLPVGHAREVYSAQFSPDGKLIITASGDGTIKIWESSSLKLLKTLIGHSTVVFYATFTPDGKHVVSYCYDGSVKVWDFATGRDIYTVTDLSRIERKIYVSPDGRKILGKGKDTLASVWDLEKKRKITGSIITRSSSEDESTLAFSRDSKYILSKVSGIPYVWDAENGKLIWKVDIVAAKDIIYFGFTPVSKKLLMIFVVEKQLKAIIYDIPTGKPVNEIVPDKGFMPQYYSVNGERLMYCSREGQVMIWGLDDMKKRKTVQINIDSSNDVTISRNSRHLFVHYKNRLRIYDAETGQYRATISESDLRLLRDPLSESGNLLLCESYGQMGVFDLSKGERRGYLTGNIIPIEKTAISPDGKQVIVASADNSMRAVNIANGQTVFTVDDAGPVNFIQYSKQENFFITTFHENLADSAVRIWDAKSGKLLHKIKAHNEYLTATEISNDGSFFITGSGDGSFKLWNTETGSLVFSQSITNSYIGAISISSDDKFFLTHSLEEITVWDIQQRKKTLTIERGKVNKPGEIGLLEFAILSPSGKEIVITDDHGNVGVYNRLTGDLVRKFTIPPSSNNFIRFSPDGKKMLVIGKNSFSGSIFNVDNWSLLYTKKCNDAYIEEAEFSPDSRYFLSAGRDQKVKVFDTETGKEVYFLSGHSAFIKSAVFSPDGKKIITSTSIGDVNIWDTKTGSLQYTFIPVLDDNYLVFDSKSRYDGSNVARKLLYFTCGTEIIELEQVKDQLWVTDLAERIMKGDTINAPTLDELNICGLTPKVENVGSLSDEYYFKITPRRGGLGETAVFINGIEAKRYKPEQLRKNGASYDLRLKKDELKSYFIAGQENPVTIKAYTTNNTITSRSVIIDEENNDASIPPNLFAVMVGVSDYKGDEMDLKYAAKDANDLSAALGVAARKLLNKDGKEHVFIYNLTTDKEHYQVPEKKSIKKILADIGKKATASDILLIFFAGHGMMGGVNKQFYFLTADASKASAASAADAVGISTAELSEWMKPQNIKAQKRILIFDACNSGQLIREFVKIGTEDQNYLTARDDEKGQQTKAIEELNGKSGLFILAASASNQNAYEMSRYSQGVLTYSLLRAIKQQPAILENGKYLNVNRWFNEADKSVKEMSKESGARQQPQIVSTTTFNIGEVDDEVIAKIILPPEKPLFTDCNLQNSDVNISADDIGLNKIIDNYLSAISSRGRTGTITFILNTNAPDAYTLGGRYEIKGIQITARINVLQNNQVRHRFELNGTTEKLNELAKAIADKAAEIVGGVGN